jgi:D-lactate dehydrogenase
MCCGTAQNSYNTLAAIRVMLADGTLLDTADAASVAAFKASHGGCWTAWPGCRRAGARADAPWPAASAPVQDQEHHRYSLNAWWTSPTRWTSSPT